MEVINVTAENFENEVTKSNKTVLIDFWASWCGPCKMLSPIVEEIADESDEYKVVKINVDEQPQLSAQFSIISIPTLVVMKNGQTVKKSVGVIPKDEILSMIQN